MGQLMKHNFSQIPVAEMQRSTIKRPSRHLTTFNSGLLIPFYIDEVLPGDTFKMNTQIFARMTAQKVPIMDNLYMDTFWFFVPNRLLWKHWVNFMGEQNNQLEMTEYLVPTIKTEDLPGAQTQFNSGSLEDYFGLPIGVTDLEVCSFWHRAYSKIFNDWFRDENLVTESPFTDEDSDIDPATSKVYTYGLRARGKRHDYFTSCLPWPQAGQPVALPVGGEAPVFGNGRALGLRAVNSQNTGINLSPLLNNASGEIAWRANPAAYGENIGQYAYSTSVANSFTGQTVGVVPKSATNGAYQDSGLVADLSEASAIYINDLRIAIQTQKFLERMARGGHRYIEILLAHFQVVSPDARLQRSEYLGGNNSSVNIHPIAQTSGTTETGTPQANLAGMATVSHRTGFAKSFTEHGVLMGILNIRADLTYQQGLHKMFKRETRLDFLWPVFCHLGEEPVFNYEIYAQGSSAVNPVSGVPYDEEVFGYKPRYDEYRWSKSLITGFMRSTVTAGATLHQWHLSQNFNGLPRLNETFISENVPLDRCLAVTTQPEFLADIFNDLTCSRCIPVNGEPGWMDHF